MFIAESHAGEPTSHLWLKKPKSTDFNAVANWLGLVGGRAPANMPVGSNQPKEQAFAEYDFELPPPGGRLALMGRTFDPKWSSPARWRVDQEPWQAWDPGPLLNREVANKIFPLQWHQWGEVELTPGKHTLRVETLGKRARGDYPYFVLDVLMLSRGTYAPQGAKTPADAVAEKLEILSAKARTLPNAAAFGAKAKTIAEEVLSTDLSAFDKFETLADEIDGEVEVQRLLEISRRPQLHGKLTAATLEADRTVVLETDWNASFKGKVWIGFFQGTALYATVMQKVDNARNHVMSFALPANLPAGKIRIACIPVDQEVTVFAGGYLDVPEKLAAARPVAHAYGIYRDSQGKAHPWEVNDNNMMFWDGEPYIPFGGMLNSPLSWTAKAGDATVNTQWTEYLRHQMTALKERGIRDVYFNGFFLHASPQSLAAMVAIAEECGMRYGLHPSSMPAQTDRGFLISRNPVAVAVGERDMRIIVKLNPGEDVPGARCVWGAADAEGRIVASGVGVLSRVEAKTGEKADAVEFELQVSLPEPAGAEGLNIHFAVERKLSRGDPNGYLGTLDEYLARYAEAYGSLPLGPGMRLWIDPLQNEMHHNPDSVGATPLWQKRLAQWLFGRYGTLEKLREGWGCGAGPVLPDFATAARLVPLGEQGDGEREYWMDPDDGVLYSFGGRRGQALRDVREFSGVIAEEMISRCADALKQIADVPVILKHNCWFSDWFVNPRASGGQDGCGYEPYCYGDSLAYHNTLVPYAQVLQSGRRQWALVTESSAAAFEGQTSYAGYLDRLQMMDNIDQLMMFGAKGFYHFGFAFAGNPMFDTTDLLRDIRQVEWLATHAKTYEASAVRLSGSFHPPTSRPPSKHRSHIEPWG